MIHRGTNVRAARSAWSLGWMAVLALLVGVCMTPASAQTVFFTQDEASDSNDEVLSVDAAGQQTVVGNTIKTVIGSRQECCPHTIFWRKI